MEKLNLEAETICNYYVDEKMKKVWQVQLDMVEKIDKICEENNIKYFLAGGSLLGAVRHHGYIPWDDDIDIMMKREEYLKFLESAQKELTEPYFVQYYKTEPKYDKGHAQIRNSETTAIIKEDKNNKFNKGIFVDIFPLDNIPDNKIERKWFIFKTRLHRVILYTYYINDYKNKFVLSLVKAFAKVYWKIFDFQKSINKFERNIQKYNNRETKQCGALGFRPNEFKYDNSWFESTIKLDFQYLKLNASPNYHESLTRQYGDYMKIPKNNSGTIHGKVFFDTEKSYKEYENKIDKIIN